jgi:hypothetical protein
MPQPLSTTPETWPKFRSAALFGLLQILRVRWKLSPAHRLFLWLGSFAWPALGLYVFRNDPRAQFENGPIETFQVSVIALGALLLCASFWPRPVSFRTKFIVGGLAIIYMIFFLLEFDTRAMDAPILRRLTNGWVRNTWVTLLVVAYTTTLLRHANQLWAVFIEWIWSLPALYFILAGFFWVFAEIIDKLKPVRDPDMAILVEEIIEMDAAVWMLAAAIATRLLVKKFDANAKSPLQTPL